MQITFVSQARFPTEKAHGHQIAQVCESLARLGHAVTLVAPDVANTVHVDHREYYGLKESFAAVRLPVLDGHRTWWIPGALAFFFTMRSYARVLRSWLRANPTHLLYTRSPRLLPALLSANTPVVLELHTLPRRTERFLSDCRICAGIVCLTEPMRRELLSWGVAPERILVEGDGVDPARFAMLPERKDAREQWKLPSDRAIIVYVGSLVTRGVIEKGVRELIQAAAFLKQDRENDPSPLRFRSGQAGLSRLSGRGVAEGRFFLWVIGGPREHVKEYQTIASQAGLLSEEVRFEGPVRSARVPSALAAADVCVYPAPKSRHPFFLRDTSPLKVFEYLASGRPTVCADLPPLRGVIDPALAHFCPPGDPRALAEAIAEALRDPKTNKSARRALLERVSWDARMKRILETVTARETR